MLKFVLKIKIKQIKKIIYRIFYVFVERMKEMIMWNCKKIKKKKKYENKSQKNVLLIIVDKDSHNKMFSNKLKMNENMI